MAALQMGDIHAGDHNEAIGRSRSPLKSPYAVVTDSRPHRAEDKVLRQAGEQRGHRFGDRSMALYGGLRLVQHGVFSIEFADRDDAPPGVALAEYPRQIRLHYVVIVNDCRLWLIDHRSPSAARVTLVRTGVLAFLTSNPRSAPASGRLDWSNQLPTPR